MQSTTNKDDNSPKSLRQALSRARRLLGDRLEADLLACHALGRERSWLYAHDGDPIDNGTLTRLDELIAQRLDGRPIAQICGLREFYGRDFGVNEHVLIPRPETELLVDVALSLELPDNARVCDVGMGSGCIALTLAAERPGWRITGIDRSVEALTAAAANRDRLGLQRVELLPGDLLAPVAERRFELIVSNPPYIAEDDPHLRHGDLRFEPIEALAAGPDGFEVIRRLVPASLDQLETGGWLLIEHGYDQATAVRALFEAAGFSSVSSRRDLAGIERVTLGKKPDPAP
ncbi:peptide chain release factor N(5)-glutamine methyltransferase [Wenzhouxiangella sediminis]|uniref:Release factor glutamine methyltransferase n=1 Tax=Wenzhouxiangella sediminis TaxID=1792836 RepID=A0A3E1K9I4_9GAMM|nr:peptide chain release factor N(5)-glutamine methyltransferase [Wenzhouxiangella sediminis]RFF30843.1 peptide chain release factor N(5)-glutamine methyltransferase [Wenzhouxiangella sediminis]